MGHDLGGRFHAGLIGPAAISEDNTRRKMIEVSTQLKTIVVIARSRGGGGGENNEIQFIKYDK